MKYTLEHDMLLLFEWYKANQLSLNVNKTVLGKFWSGGRPFNIKIIGVEVHNVQSTKFLGIILNENLNWNEHAENLHSKLLMGKQMLARAKNFLNADCLKSVYYTHIYSHMIYGLSIWGSMVNNAQWEKIYKTQKACVCLIAKKPTNSHCDSLFTSLKIIMFLDLIKWNYVN